jgi:hypothetical protein
MSESSATKEVENIFKWLPLEKEEKMGRLWR